MWKCNQTGEPADEAMCGLMELYFAAGTTARPVRDATGEAGQRPKRISPVQRAQNALENVAGEIERAVLPESLFTAEQLDCISGIETGRTWDRNKAGPDGRVGLFQFNENSWKYSGTSLPWENGKAAKDPYQGATVAIALLYRTLGYNGVANPTDRAIISELVILG